MAESLVNTRQFKFELVAPEKVEISRMEERVLLPGELGDFVVLPGHTLLLAALRPGVVSIFQDEKNATQYFINGGLADIGNTHCIVLTPQIIPVASLYAEKISTEIARLESQLSAANENHAQEHLRHEIELAQIKLEAARKYNI